MHQINVSLVGVAVTEVRSTTTEAGHAVAKFRLVCRPRKFDSATGSFVDCEPSYVTVLSWRHLAEHVAASVRKGDQVLVSGRMRVREWSQDGRSRVSVEVDAHAVGLDLSRGAVANAREPIRRSGIHDGAAVTPDAEPSAAAGESALMRDVA